jgi:deoxyribonuclease-4
MSIAGGLHRAIDHAEAVDATALQVFVKSARQWSSQPIAVEEAQRFRERAGESGLGPHTLAHASYLINLAAPAGPVRRRSLVALADEIARCELLAIPYLVLHPGSHTGAGEEAGLERIVRALDEVLAPSGGRSKRDRSANGITTVLLETTAGQGATLGHRFEHLAYVLERARSTERLGVCFDTCHALAAGYEFRDRRSFRATFREFDEVVGIDRLHGFHLNDSKHPFGSRKDRHEHIGRGEVGLEAFRLILADRRFRRIPMVLETPKGPDLAEDRENMSVLRQMLPVSRR